VPAAAILLFAAAGIWLTFQGYHRTADFLAPAFYQVAAGAAVIVFLFWRRRERLAWPRGFGNRLSALLQALHYYAEWSLAGWMPLFLVLRLGTSPRSAAIVTALYCAAALGGSRVRVVRRRYLAVSVSAAFLGCLLLLATDNRLGAGVGAALSGAGLGSARTLVDQVAARRVPASLAGPAAAALLPALLGAPAYFFGIAIVSWAAAAASAAAFAVLLLNWLEAKVTGAPG